MIVSKALYTWYCYTSDERIPGVLYKIMKNYYDLLKSEKIKLFEWGKARWFEAFITMNYRLFNNHGSHRIVIFIKT